MTLPRRVLPGTTYLYSRRTADRHFYLRPSEKLNEIYLYALAHAQMKHGVLIHAFACMSDHSHEHFTDVRGVMPDFTRDFHREVALAVKALHGVSENVWSADKGCAVELHGPAAQLEAALYTLANPVEAGLVARASDWPGAISLPWMRRIEVRRPDVWFGEERPEVLTLELTPPPTWTEGADEWHRWLDEELGRREAELRAERAKERKTFLGRARVLAAKPSDRPTSPDEPEPSRVPVLKTAGDGALMRLVIGALRDWRRAYYEARERWRSDKSTEFPLGTWWVVRRAGATVAAC